MLKINISEDQINSLSESELIILKFLNANQKKVTTMSIREFANRVNFSTATISRFCLKIGLEGYSELKYAVKKSLTSQPKGNKNTMLHKSKVMSKDTINTLSLINPDDLLSIARKISQSTKIHLFGTGISGITIEYFEKLLFSCGMFNVFRYETSKLCNHSILKMGKDELLIVVSASGEFAPTINSVKLAKVNGASVLAITPYNQNEIASNASMNIRFFGDLRENYGAEYTTRLPVFYIFNLLFKSILLLKEGELNEIYYQ